MRLAIDASDKIDSSKRAIRQTLCKRHKTIHERPFFLDRRQAEMVTGPALTYK
jgi:hypothetical protein